MHLAIFAPFNSIEFYLLKVTVNANSKYERGNGARKHEQFPISNFESGI